MLSRVTHRLFDSSSVSYSSVFQLRSRDLVHTPFLRLLCITTDLPPMGSHRHIFHPRTWTSQSQISYPHAGSPWTFCLYTHPLPHALSHTLSASEHTTSVSLRRCSPRLLRKMSFPQLSFFFCAFFSPSFLARDDPRSTDPLLYESGSCGEKASTLRVRWTSFVKFQVL